MAEKKNFLQQIDGKVFTVPAIVLIIFVLMGIIIPSAAGSAAAAAFSFMTQNLGWIYQLTSIVFIVFCLWAAFGKYGNVKFGGADAEPEMSFFSWFCIAFTSGMGIGVGYFGVAEPMTLFMNPPEFTKWTAHSGEAAEGVLGLVYMHWCLHPYAIYTSVGVACGIIIWNAHRRFSFASAFEPLVGRQHTEGTFGKVVTALSVIAVVGSTGTSMGLGVSQISSSVNYVLGTNFTPENMAILIISVLCFIYTLSACSGLHKGIQSLSRINMYFFFVLMAWALVFGGITFIVNNTVTGIGQYLYQLIPQSFYMGATQTDGYVGNWTIFFLAAWIAIAPLIGLFLTKLAKGRTIRQFVFVNMMAPCIFSFFWFGIFGSSSMKLSLGGTNIAQQIDKWGSPAALFIYLKNLPLFPVMVIIGFLTVVLSFVTMAESITLTLADMTTKVRSFTEKITGELSSTSSQTYRSVSELPQAEQQNNSQDNSENETQLNETVRSGEGVSPVGLRIFWGVLIGFIAFALFYSGGLKAIQTSSIVCALPISVLMVVMVISAVKGMKTIDLKTGELQIDESETKE